MLNAQAQTPRQLGCPEVSVGSSPPAQLKVLSIGKQFAACQTDPSLGGRPFFQLRPPNLTQTL